jgi:hypothetical protein
VALIRTDASEDRIASIFRLHECEQVTERSSKLLYRHRLVEDSDMEASDLHTEISREMNPVPHFLGTPHHIAISGTPPRG